MKLKLVIQIFVMAIVMIYTASNLLIREKEAPAKMKWIKDGILKWITFLFLSSQSIASLTNCGYLALITKYPLMAKEIRDKLMMVFNIDFFGVAM